MYLARFVLLLLTKLAISVLIRLKGGILMSENNESELISRIQSLESRIIVLEKLAKIDTKENKSNRYIKVYDSLYRNVKLGLTYQQKLIVSGLKMTSNYRQLAWFLGLSETAVYSVIKSLRAKNHIEGFTPRIVFNSGSYSNLPISLFRDFSLNLVEANLYWKLLMTSENGDNSVSIELKTFIGLSYRTLSRKLSILESKALIACYDRNKMKYKIIDFRQI